MRVIYNCTKHEYRCVCKLRELHKFSLKITNIQILLLMSNFKPNSFLVKDDLFVYVKPEPLALTASLHAIIVSPWHIILCNPAAQLGFQPAPWSSPVNDIITCALLEVTRVAMTKQVGFAGRGFVMWLWISSVFGSQRDEICLPDSLEITVEKRNHRQHNKMLLKHQDNQVSTTRLLLMLPRPEESRCSLFSSNFSYKLYW